MDGCIAAGRAWEAVSIKIPPRTTTPSFLAVFSSWRGAQGRVIHGWQLTKSRHVKGGSLAPLTRRPQRYGEYSRVILEVSDSSFLDVP